jgi:drug/metabolite transporter (DMT)-like permease
VNRRAWLLFAATSVIWGGSFLFIRVAVAHMAPSLVVFGRCLLGAAVLVPLAARKGALAGLRRAILPVAAVTCLDMALPTFLTAWGEERVSSSAAGILTATDPLFTAVLALWLIRSEAVGRRRFAGLVIGFAGVVALLGLDFHGQPAELAGAGAVLLAAAMFAAAALVYRRWLAGVPALTVTAAMAVLSSAAFAGPAAVALPRHPPPLASILAVGALGVVNTGLAYWLFYLLIDEAGAATAGVITYVMPVVALVLGVAVLGESLTAAAIVGMVLIAAGAWLATGGHVRGQPGRANGRPGDTPRHDRPPAVTGAAAQRRIGRRPPG